MEEPRSAASEDKPDAVEREYAYLIARSANDPEKVVELQYKLARYRAIYKNCESHKQAG